MGILFLPARQGRCSGLLFCSAVRPLLLLRLRPRPTLIMGMDMALATLAFVATVDTEDMVLVLAVDIPALDTPDSVATLDSDTLVVTTASVRLRLSPRLMLRLIPIMDTEDTAVDTPASDLATAVATLEDADTDTAMVTDTTVESKKPKDQHNTAFP